MAVPSTLVTQQRGGGGSAEVVVVVGKARTGSCLLAMCPTLLANYIDKNSIEQKLSSHYCSRHQFIVIRSYNICRITQR